MELELYVIHTYELGRVLEGRVGDQVPFFTEFICMYDI